MCGRFSLKRTDFNTYEEWLDYRKHQYEDVRRNPVYNASPGMKLPVFRTEADGKPVVEWMRWGLLQPWNKNKSDAYKTFNARVEGLWEKPTWKKVIKHQRCLIPADGWYEWKEISQENAADYGIELKGKKPAKVPNRIRLKNEDVFTFAGIWNGWVNPETGEFIPTFSIITKPAEHGLDNLHHRMPVVLPVEAHENWLEPGRVEQEDVQPILEAVYQFEFEYYAVTPALGRSDYQEADAIKPIVTGRKEYKNE